MLPVALETEARNATFAKGPNPGRSGKVPGRQTGRGNDTETASIKKAAILEGPGRFREGKREGRNRLSKKPQSGKVREGSGKVSGKGVSLPQATFLTVSGGLPLPLFTGPDFPKSIHVFTGRKYIGNGKL